MENWSSRVQAFQHSNKNMPKKKPPQINPDVHEDLEGFDIKINEFGEIISNYRVDKLNEFLNEKIADKKLREQPSAATDEEE